MVQNQPYPDSIYIAGTNDAVDIFNSRKLHQHPGSLWTAKGKDTGNKRSLAGLRHCKLLLQLKVGAPIIITANLTDCQNGSRGVVIKLDQHKQFVVVQVNGKAITITKQIFYKRHGGIVSTREQFPLKLAWALTVHRCQGQTLEKITVDCRGFFLNNQLSVAISRVRNISDVRLVNFNIKSVKPIDSELQQYLDTGTIIQVRNTSVFFNAERG